MVMTFLSCTLAFIPIANSTLVAAVRSPPNPLQSSHAWPSLPACVRAAETQTRVACAGLRPAGCGRLSVHSSAGCSRVLCGCDGFSPAAADWLLVLQAMHRRSCIFMRSTTVRQIFADAHMLYSLQH